MTRVVVMEDYLDVVRNLECTKRLASRVDDLKIYTTKAGSEDEVFERLQHADIAITIRDRVMFPDRLRAHIKPLRLLSGPGGRSAPHIDLEAATRHEILVCCPPSRIRFGKSATAELTWG